MKRNLKFILEVLRLLVGFINEFTAAIEEKANIKAITDQIPDLLKRILDNLDIQAQPIQGATQLKQEIRSRLIKSLYPVMTIIHDYAQQQQDKVLVGEMRTSWSQLSNLSSEALLSQSRNTVNYCTGMGEQLPNIGIAANMFDTLKTNLTEYENVVAEPKQRMNRRKEATNQLEIQRNEAEHLVYKRLTPLMESYFAQSNPVLWEKYENAVNPGKIPTHKLAAIGSIRDAETGEPVVNCWLEIPGTNIAYRTTGRKGLFRIQNLEPGEYALKCTHGSYETTTLNFTHVWGQTNRLIIDLRMTETAREEKLKLEEQTKTRE